MSRREVIVCRGIWYVMALLSLFGLSISLNLLWPPGGKSPALSRFLRDGAVSATTFYAVTLLRYLLFTDTPSSNSYKDFTTDKERIPQVVFAEFSTLALFCSPYLLVDHPDHDVWLYMSLFTISLFTGGIGLIQLSDKFRMDMKHAYITLLCGWLCWLLGSYVFIYLPSMPVAMIPIGVYWMFFLSILLYNFCSEELSINSRDSPLPA
ncbi:unnamed protein product [Brassica rapa]|uniref:Uncharacterized protein n=1 Tax=Brassica campestris TaxID=3711 RepID=A0A3P5ZTH9_BRACM|nr:unnamed protein product [Brassica rapa]VDC83532.1 unnamed protein product [Brassica rapa]